VAPCLIDRNINIAVRGSPVITAHRPLKKLTFLLIWVMHFKNIMHSLSLGRNVVDLMRNYALYGSARIDVRRSQ
jgi:hypothetical protein